MIIIQKAADLALCVDSQRGEGKTIGFVPTMGALHEGHISLITQSKEKCDFSICSIFVNPTQFNNPADLDKYPRTIEKDIDMLDAAGCDLLFLPAKEEIYPEGFRPETYDLGHLETLLEGAYRPGHFQGVCMVVDRLLQMCKPDVLFLGQKDLQQCAVIKKLTVLKNIPVRVETGETIRESGGLAMSSRNMRLSEEDKLKAQSIFRALQFMKENIRHGDLSDLKISAAGIIEKEGLKIEYADIVAVENFQLLKSWDGSVKIAAVIAAYMGEVRLIDNLFLN